MLTRQGWGRAIYQDRVVVNDTVVDWRHRDGFLTRPFQESKHESEGCAEDSPNF